MENTFQHKIKFIAKEFILEKKDWETKMIEKDVTFKELTYNDKSQTDIFQMLFPLFDEPTSANKKKLRFNVDSKILTDITIEYIETSIVCDEDFTESHKTELLNDRLAIIALSNWLVNNKFAPFFLDFVKNYLI